MVFDSMSNMFYLQLASFSSSPGVLHTAGAMQWPVSCSLISLCLSSATRQCPTLVEESKQTVQGSAFTRLGLV